MKKSDQKKLWKGLGEQLQIRRKRAGFTQRELAKQIDVTDAFISYIERGQRGVSLETLFDLSAALGCAPSRLVPGITTPANKRT